MRIFSIQVLMLFVFLFIVARVSASTGCGYDIKGMNRSFNETYCFKLINGAVYYKKPNGKWRPVLDTGKPHAEGVRESFFTERDIVQISVDAENLIAVTDDRRIYTLIDADRTPERFRWTRRWGFPFWWDKGIWLPENRTWHASHTAHDGIGTYEDIDGNSHTVGAGITSVYLVSADGRRIYYADPWLPADFSRQVCAPENGRLEIVNMSVSSSMIFVLGRDGSLYTRVADFDNMGGNPFIQYSWWKTRGFLLPARRLPAPPWERHVSIKGRITKKLSIIRTGRTNRGFELRVSGWDEAGRRGYFKKSITARQWDFVPTDEAEDAFAQEMIPDHTAVSITEEKGRSYAGFWNLGKGRRLAVRIPSHNRHCPPVAVELGKDKARGIYNLFLYETLVVHKRKQDVTPYDEPIKMNGALFHLSGKKPLGKEKIIPVFVFYDEDRITIRFRQPSGVKGVIRVSR